MIPGLPLALTPELPLGLTPWLNSWASFWLNSRASSWLNSRASSWPATLQPLCLGREPKVRVATVTLGKKLWFSTMVLIMFQLHLEVEYIISNCKMFFSTQNGIFNCLPK